MMNAPENVVPRGWQGLDMPSYEIINSCVRCGLCLPTCPTYLLNLRETSSPRGRIHLMQAVSDGALDVLDPGFAHQMYECLDCRACEAVCPSGVAYGQLVEPARHQVTLARRKGIPERLLRWAVFDRLFADMRLFRTFSRLIWLYQRGGAQWLARRSGLLRALGLARTEALLPRMSSAFLIPRGQEWRPAGEPQYRVGLFAGCVMSTAFAATDAATVRVLQRNGCTVLAPEGQGCCGALHVHAGELDRGRALMKRNIEAFEQQNLDAVIVNAAGCGAALKEYGHLLERDPAWAERARRFSERVWDVTAFLGTLELDPRMGTLDAVVTYQEPCHLVHAQRISKEPRRLLRAIPGVQLVEMEESAVCCGSAGIYNITEPERSTQLLDRKLAHALATHPDVIASANPGCILQLQSGLRARGSSIRVAHVVDLFDEAYEALQQ
ncbi:MAG: heterodisulfide reductase-related iron-sulfur binding cluster [Chloroflexota bacterium]|nr:heterodisulfide reductase-related iron-sulfur binding cluster [Chloroflexota bacterium]